ncbi:hypothetical protein DFH08DRAFT_810031 [Mycena albidolilacea]|uniref:Uncharacterized protein n=1 Tax=Mycena albidolilacea TaxID=1033008 RepID=A0AAD7EQD0_9AGAR|nr:hypothetical protein DFH08DRAFT_810031 [Mycena albidolilacea]
MVLPVRHSHSSKASVNHADLSIPDGETPGPEPATEDLQAEAESERATFTEEGTGNAESLVGEKIPVEAAPEKVEAEFGISPHETDSIVIDDDFALLRVDTSGGCANGFICRGQGRALAYNQVIRVGQQALRNVGNT